MKEWEDTMFNLMRIVIVAATMVLIGCGGGNGDGGGEPSGEGVYQLTPMVGDPYEIKKTVLFHSLTQVTTGGECYYSFRIVPDADQQVPDDDPFDQYIDVFYGNPGGTDNFGSAFVYQNVEYSFGQATPTRSPADPSTEPLVEGGTYNSANESGTFDFILDPNLSKQLPPVTDCVN